MGINFNNSLSALSAYGLGIAVGADNISRMNVDGAEKNRTVYSSTETGGVSATIQPIPMEQALINNPSPYGNNNIDVAEEFIYMMINEVGYKTNAKVVNVENKMLGTLLNIKV